LGLKTAVVERDKLGRHLPQLGLHPDQALLRSAEIFHLMHRSRIPAFSADI